MDEGLAEQDATAMFEVSSHHVRYQALVLCLSTPHDALGISMKVRFQQIALVERE